MLLNLKRKILSILTFLSLSLFTFISYFYITEIYLPSLLGDEFLLANNRFIHNYINDQFIINPNVVINPKSINNANIVYPPLEIIKNELDISSENFDKLKKVTYLIDDIKMGIYLEDLVEDLNDKILSFNIKIIDEKAKVFKVEIDSNFYILKRLSKHSTVNSNDLLADQFDNENIVKILASFSRNMGKNKSYIWFISEYLDYPAYSDYIFNGDLETIRKIAVDLINGLSALHKENVVHGDLYTRNVRGNLKEDGTVMYKLIDLGLAKKINNEQKFIKEAQQDFGRLEALLFNMANIIGDFDDIPEEEKKNFLDFRLVAGGFTENKLENIEDLFAHPFITGASLGIENDKFGKRKEYENGNGFIKNWYN